MFGWNFTAGADDLKSVKDESVDCARVREALSALLDGEDPAVEVGLVEGHRAECPACARWYTDAARLNRQLRLRIAAATGPDVTEKVLARVRLPRRRRLWQALRIALLITALAQLGIGVSSLVLPMGMPAGMPMDAHLDHEEAAFNLAFAAALLLVTLAPRRAATQLPVLGSFVLVLAAASVIDLADGAVSWPRLTTHIPVALGLLLAAVLTRSHHPTSAPTDEATATSGDHADSDRPDGRDDENRADEPRREWPAPPSARQHSA